MKLPHLALSLLAALGMHSAMAAEAYPAKPVRWVVAFSAGGGSDILARTVGLQLSKQLGQQIVVDNKPGGATVIAAESVARSPGDGYTVFTADNGTLIFNTALFKRLSYEPKKDFAPIGMMARFPLVLATNPASGFATAKEAIEAMRKQPGKFSYASSGVGSPHHLAMEMLKERARIDVTHVPYKGGAPAVQDVAGGQLPFIVIDIATGLPMIKAGKLKVLATFSKSRLAAMPDVPTLMELGYTDIEATAWQGLVVPASTPKAIQDQLSSELQKAINIPAVSARLVELGVEPLPSDAAAMNKRWSDDAAYWPKLIKDRQITLDQ